MIKKIIPLIIAISILVSAVPRSEIVIQDLKISENSQSEFLISYSIKNTFDVQLFSNLQIVLPFENYIIEGSIENNLINEKDLLFSQLNLDLNGDTDILDSFKIQIINNKPAVDNIKLSSLTRKTQNYHVLIPYNEAGNFNVNSLTKNGKPFTLRGFSSAPSSIIIGLNTEGDIEFRKFPNSLLFIELVTADKNSKDKIQIYGQKPFTGITNEKELTGGESLYRFAVSKSIIVNDDSAKGEIKISGTGKPFLLRITYYFALSKNLILTNQKIIRVN